MEKMGKNSARVEESRQDRKLVIRNHVKSRKIKISPLKKKTIGVQTNSDYRFAIDQAYLWGSHAVYNKH